MNELRKRFERLCLKNRNKGIPNLMLWFAILNVAVYVLNSIDPSNTVYNLLCFSRAGILHGQVWRLFTYLFTYMIDSSGQILLAALALFCCYQFGRMLEQTWGAFRFDLYILTGVVLMDIFALLVNTSVSALSLYLSIFLAVATIAPEAKVLLFFIIPVKFKYMAWVYFGITIFDIVQYLMGYGLLSFAWLLPIIPLLNYFLFFGSEIENVLPDFLKPSHRPRSRPAPHARPNANWAAGYQSKSGERPYRHKCAVCGKTDTEYPNMEFRYCSKCNGYYCYCMEHINNHVHIQ